MNVEMNRMIQTSHDLHPRRRGGSCLVTDLPKTKVDSMDAQRTVHGVIV